jgi:hypothetical protein
MSMWDSWIGGGVIQLDTDAGRQRRWRRRWHRDIGIDFGRREARGAQSWCADTLPVALLPSQLDAFREAEAGDGHRESRSGVEVLL